MVACCCSEELRISCCRICLRHEHCESVSAGDGLMVPQRLRADHVLLGARHMPAASAALKPRPAASLLNYQSSREHHGNM